MNEKALEIYKRIDELNFSSNKECRELETIGDFATHLNFLVNLATNNFSQNEPQSLIENRFWQIAVTGFKAMEFLGAPFREEETDAETIIKNSSRNQIKFIVELEKEIFEKELGNVYNKIKLGDFLCCLRNVCRNIDLVFDPNNSYINLLLIRKLTAIAVICLERFITEDENTRQATYLSNVKLDEEFDIKSKKICLDNELSLWFDLKPCQHEYPSPWFGIQPPSCKKCGYIAKSMKITCNAEGLITKEIK